MLRGISLSVAALYGLIEWFREAETTFPYSIVYQPWRTFDNVDFLPFCQVASKKW